LQDFPAAGTCGRVAVDLQCEFTALQDHQTAQGTSPPVRRLLLLLLPAYVSESVLILSFCFYLSVICAILNNSTDASAFPSTICAIFNKNYF
jgi:hypothetical protein